MIGPVCHSFFGAFDDTNNEHQLLAMSDSRSNDPPTIGFLTVLQQPRLGLLGGYLILNAVGRPLEFHCTAPVRPNRAQEILYGSTLEPYLFGEQIGSTLLKKAKVKPQLVLTDVRPALELREHTKIPVALVVGSPADIEAPSPALKIATTRIDSAQADVPAPKHLQLIHFQLGATQLAIAARHEEDRDQILRDWDAHTESLDFSEPFGRIRDAIDEAQKSRA